MHKPCSLLRAAATHYYVARAESSCLLLSFVPATPTGSGSVTSQLRGVASAKKIFPDPLGPVQHPIPENPGYAPVGHWLLVAGVHVCVCVCAEEGNGHWLLEPATM